MKDYNEFIAKLKTMKWLDNHGPAPEGVKLFETQADALDAAKGAARDAAGDAAWSTTWDAAWSTARNAAGDAARITACDAAWITARDAARDAAGDVAWIIAWEAAYDAALYCALMYLCNDLDIPAIHIEHVKKRWAVWASGNGVVCDVDGELYCYKHIS